VHISILKLNLVFKLSKSYDNFEPFVENILLYQFLWNIYLNYLVRGKNVLFGEMF
jgi:hypothetical protein